MSFLEEFQQRNRDARDAYVREAIEDAKHDYLVNVAKVMKSEKINADKAKRILSEGFDIKPSQAFDIWENLR